MNYSLGNMNRIAIDSHRSLFSGLFAVFELLLLVSVVALWCIDPRRMSGLDDAAGITVFFFGLSVVSWLLRRAAPRMARVGLITVVGSFIACSFARFAYAAGEPAEALKGDRASQHSVRINDQWRICFVWRGGNAEQVEIVDYH